MTYWWRAQRRDYLWQAHWWFWSDPYSEVRVTPRHRYYYMRPSPANEPKLQDYGWQKDANEPCYYTDDPVVAKCALESCAARLEWLALLPRLLGHLQLPDLRRNHELQIQQR